MTEKEYNRILWVDYAKAVLIFFVALLHTGLPTSYKEVIRMFVIPFFFFLSGIFFRPERYKSYTEFFKQKGVKILIPYLFFNLVTYLFWLLIGRKFGLDSESTIHPAKPLLGVLYGTSTMMQHYVPLWFLACLFMVESIYYLVCKYAESTKNCILVITVLVVIGCVKSYYISYPFPWGIDIALIMLAFYAFGNLAKDKFLTPKKTSLFTQLVIIFGFFGIVFLMSILNSEVKVFINSYGNFFYFFIGAFAGIISLSIAFQLLEKVIKKQNWFLFVGQNTLIILALHLIAISFVKAIFVYILKFDLADFQNSLVFSVSFSVLAILVLVPVINFINKYLPFVVGKKRA
ncbi:MAG TPA: acyltransferase family protein [Bacteroidales bacterium]|nr:acyltransferase family protein [Bacteroidales bacterium]